VNESLQRLYKLHICTKNQHNEIRMSEVFQENLNNALIGRYIMLYIFYFFLIIY